MTYLTREISVMFTSELQTVKLYFLHIFTSVNGGLGRNNCPGK